MALLSAVGFPPFPPRRPPWAPRVVAGRAMRVAVLRRSSVAPSPGCGLPTRASIRAGFPGQRTAGCQPGRWGVAGPGLGSGPGWGPGDCEMIFLWAAVLARLVGGGAAPMPVQLVPGPADRPPGPIRWVSPQLGDWGSRSGPGLGGARCRRAWCCRCRSGLRYVSVWGVLWVAPVRGPASAGLVCHGVGGAPGRPVWPLPGRLPWRPPVDASGGIWGCGAGWPVGPGAGPICGCAAPGGCSGWVPTAAVFVGPGTAPLPAGDARCSRIALGMTAMKLRYIIFSSNHNPV